ncbi:MAG TPA: hypothetical protein VE986_02450, partial [Hyphomicrobiales bacterium]|nr:hypothetical protein [Hyphomicrobiales bacterium]
MTVIDRRKVLGLGAAAGVGLVSPVSARPFQRAYGAGPEAGKFPLHIDPAHNPVLFWNAVALDLDALDHSIDSALAAAPGPCASSRAFGIIHAVIADAVSVAYGAPYYPQFYKGPPPHIRVPPMFVGGAAAGIMAHIYNSPIHAYVIGAGRQAFQRLIGHNEGDDWQQGLTFAEYPLFREMWKWQELRPKLLPQLSNYVPRPRKHNIDPFNTGQGFYGTQWGAVEPLILTRAQVPVFAPPPPPPEGSPEYER